MRELESNIIVMLGRQPQKFRTNLSVWDWYDEKKNNSVYKFMSKMNCIHCTNFIIYLGLCCQLRIGLFVYLNGCGSCTVYDPDKCWLPCERITQIFQIPEKKWWIDWIWLSLFIEFDWYTNRLNLFSAWFTYKLIEHTQQFTA